MESLMLCIHVDMGFLCLCSTYVFCDYPKPYMFCGHYEIMSLFDPDITLNLVKYVPRISSLYVNVGSNFKNHKTLELVYNKILPLLKCITKLRGFFPYMSEYLNPDLITEVDLSKDINYFPMKLNNVKKLSVFPNHHSFLIIKQFHKTVEQINMTGLWTGAKKIQGLSEAISSCKKLYALRAVIHNIGRDFSCLLHIKNLYVDHFVSKVPYNLNTNPLLQVS